MKRGDKLYSYWNGVLTTVIFLEEGLCPGASVLTYLVRDGDRRIRCSTDHYQKTVAEAYAKTLKECQESLPELNKQLAELKQNIVDVKAEIKKLKGLIPLAKETNIITVKGAVKQDPYLAGIMERVK